MKKDQLLIYATNHRASLYFQLCAALAFIALKYWWYGVPAKPNAVALDAAFAATALYMLVRQMGVYAKMQAMGDRLKVFSDILDFKEFFSTDESMPFDEKAFQQRLRDAVEAPGLLRSLREQLATVEPFDAPTLDALVHRFVETNGIKIGQIVHALRIATTGRAQGVGLFDALSILGRDRCLTRIDRALAVL